MLIVHVNVQCLWLPERFIITTTSKPFNAEKGSQKFTLVLVTFALQVCDCEPVSHGNFPLGRINSYTYTFALCHGLVRYRLHENDSNGLVNKPRLLPPI